VPLPTDLSAEKLESRQKEDNAARAKLKDLKTTLYSNLSACYLMKKDYQMTKEYCSMVISNFYFYQLPYILGSAIRSQSRQVLLANV
jgi:hypothetical protein